MKRITPILLLSCFSMLIGSDSYAQDLTKEKTLISLYGQPGKSSLPAQAQTYLIKLKPDNTAESSGLIKNSNPNPSNKDPALKATILRQLSPSYYIVRSNDSMALSAVTAWILPANENWKCSPTLLTAISQAATKQQPGKDAGYSLLVLVTNLAAFKKQLSQWKEPVPVLEEYNISNWPGDNIPEGYNIINQPYDNIADTTDRHMKSPQHIQTAGILTLQLPRGNSIPRLLALPELIFADLRQTRARDEQVLNDVDLSTNFVPLAHRQFPNIDGSGVTGSIREDRYDTADIDFKARVLHTPLSSTLLSSHATIMATIIGGGGNSYYSGQGVAYRSVLSSFNYASLLPDPDTIYRQYGISVQNHSYGSDIENYYGAEAAAHDLSARNNPSLLHVFSAGNAGDQSATSGAYSGISGMADLTGNYKMAKNILTVGSIDSFGTVSTLSSKGPAYDGRIKPELVAFGQDGSSGAAAIVSGISLLLQQAYKLQHAGQLPASDLVKAILLNSADDVDATGIDYNTGYGSVNAYRALTTLKEKRYVTGSLLNGEIQSHSLSIPVNSQNGKITLVWNDPPAVPNAYTALVNDLDLSLVHPASGETWLPWTLNSAPSVDSLRILPQRQRDSLNNAEQVSLSNLPAGDYQIRVKGTSIPVSPQNYSLAWQWDVSNSFQWASPTGKENVLAGSARLLRWQTTLNSPAMLEYSIDAGKNWQLIDAAVNLSKKNYYWQTPDTTVAGILRMTTAAQSWYSDTFTISRPLSLSVGFNCPDSVFLYWNAVQGAAGYRVFTLGDLSLEPMAIAGGMSPAGDSTLGAAPALIRDTTLIFAKSTHPSLYYAVAPVLSDSLTGVKSYTIEYANQGVSCYVESFTADPQSGREAKLSLSLGTLYHIQDIRFEKKSTTGYQSLASIRPVNELEYVVPDEALSQGVNTYRVKITLLDGKIIYSEEETIDYLAGKDYIIYPNPLNAQSFFTILLADPANTTGSASRVFQLYNVLGQKVYETRLTYSPAQVPVSGLAGGLYFFVILQEGKKTSVGKILIN